MHLERFSVISRLPAPLEALREIAYNFWWSWDASAQALFAEMDPGLWTQIHQSPVKLLRDMSQQRLEALAEDKDFLARLKQVQEAFASYMTEGSPHPTLPAELPGPVAYFSAEFGLHESLPVYSGGLGILAGDHCKTASDLGIPLVGIGLLYKSGYFVQQLTADGIQEADYPVYNFDELPIKPVLQENNQELQISLDISGRTVHARLWSVALGRVVLYLLDTDLDTNDTEARYITSKLYGGGTETRIAQEMLLGIGGARALRALKIEPSVYHINEGHAAFLSLERIHRLRQEQQLDFDQALQAVAASQVFTTHTPVPAGHDRFGREQLERYLGSTLHNMGLPFDQFWALGMEAAHKGPTPPFCMTVLALNTARLANGVSALHGEVSREMWRAQWPNTPLHEVPISHVTNGVHSDTWLAAPIRQMFTTHLGETWEASLLDEDFWRDNIAHIPDEVLWDIHKQLKKRLISFARRHIREQRLRFKETPASIDAASKILDPHALTIGFARRFAPYKRATLIFHDPERLKAILNHSERPVQLLFAGKSHPHNQEGKDLVRDVYAFSRRAGFEGKVVFLEDYDTNVARHLVQGVDLWLNNPIRPQEASGTSGQKVPFNGGINCSILDGWWAEGYTGNNGWSIGDGIVFGDRAHQDARDARALYELLEEKIVPLFFDRPSLDSTPIGWVQCMKASMSTVIPKFNTQRMLFDYLRDLYAPAAKAGQVLREQDYQASKELSTWKRRLNAAWPQVQITDFSPLPSKPLEVGASHDLNATITLHDLQPDEIKVELYIARFDKHGKNESAYILPMTLMESQGEGQYHYRATVAPKESGHYGYSVRVLPQHQNFTHPHETALIRWAPSIH